MRFEVLLNIHVYSQRCSHPEVTKGTAADETWRIRSRLYQRTANPCSAVNHSQLDKTLPLVHSKSESHSLWKRKKPRKSSLSAWPIPIASFSDLNANSSNQSSILKTKRLCSLHDGMETGRRVLVCFSCSRNRARKETARKRSG